MFLLFLNIFNNIKKPYDMEAGLSLLKSSVLRIIKASVKLSIVTILLFTSYKKKFKLIICPLTT